MDDCRETLSDFARIRTQAAKAAAWDEAVASGLIDAGAAARLIKETA